MEYDSEVADMIVVKFVEILCVNFLEQISFDEAEAAIDCDRLIRLEIFRYDLFDLLLRLE